MMVWIEGLMDYTIETTREVLHSVDEDCLIEIMRVWNRFIEDDGSSEQRDRINLTDRLILGMNYRHGFH
jgi:hypothetical protein